MTKFLFGSTLLTLAVLVSCSAGSEVHCGTDCKCYIGKQESSDGDEAVVECDFADRQKEITLTNDLLLVDHYNRTEFKMGTLVYVLLRNAEVAHLTESFLTGWKQFPSCAIDVKQVGMLTLPDEIPNSKNKRTSFSIVETNMISFPKNLLSSTEPIITILNDSSIAYLDVADLKDDSMLKLTVNRANIGIINNSQNKTIFLLKGNSFTIENSNIGIIKSGVFNLNSSSIVKIDFYNSKIGSFESKSFYITDASEIFIEKCNIANFASDTFLIIKQAFEFNLYQNRMTLNRDTLKGFICGDYVKISENLIVPQIPIEELCINYDKDTKYSKFCEKLILQSFLDSSCSNNSLLLPTTALSQTSSSNTILLPTKTVPQTTTISSTTLQNHGFNTTPLFNPALDRKTTHDFAFNTTTTTAGSLTPPDAAIIDPDVNFKLDLLNCSQMNAALYTNTSLKEDESTRTANAVELPFVYLYMVSGFILLLILIIAGLVIKLLKRKSKGQMDIEYWPARQRDESLL